MHEEATVLSALAKLYLHVAMVTGTSFIHILHNITKAFHPNIVAQLAIIKRSSQRIDKPVTDRAFRPQPIQKGK